MTLPVQTKRGSGDLDLELDFRRRNLLPTRYAALPATFASPGLGRFIAGKDAGFQHGLNARPNCGLVHHATPSAATLLPNGDKLPSAGSGSVSTLFVPAQDYRLQTATKPVAAAMTPATAPKIGTRS